jgi:hypothetical protein
MKKLFLSLFFAAGIFVLWSQGEILFGNRRFLDEARVHKIQKGEYLSKLAEQYYGDPQRWRELALLNRAPNPDHVEVGEQILVPAANAVSEISRARTLTEVNTLFNAQDKLASREPSSSPANGTSLTTPTPSSEVATGNETAIHDEPIVETPTATAPESVNLGSDFPWLWIGVGVVALALAIVGFTLYRRRQTAQNEAGIAARKNPEDFRPRRYYGDSSSVKTESVDKDEDAKDKETDFGELHRRRYGDGTPATA